MPRSPVQYALGFKRVNDMTQLLSLLPPTATFRLAPSSNQSGERDHHVRFSR